MDDYQQQSSPVIIGAGAGRRLTVGDSTLWLKLTGEAAGGGLSVTEYVLSPRFAGPPAHKRRTFEHAWYVLEGCLMVQVERETLELETGSFIFIPKRAVQAFSNPGDAVVLVVVVDTPGGFEKYYDDLQAAFGSGQAIDHEQMRQIQLKYDTYLPDYIF